jgi:inosine/xanthosine triphosphatase
VIILIGSTRPAKVEGARAAIEAIAACDARFRDAVVEPVDVTDVAPAMPMSEADMIRGAHDRAAAVLRRRGVPAAGVGSPHGVLSPAALAIGVEGGLDPLGDRYVLKTWAAATDGTRWSYGAGGAVLLPDAIARDVVAGRELGDVIDEIAGTPVRGTRGAWGLLTRDLVGRRDAFKLAVVAALAPFYNPALYGTQDSELNT